MYEKVLALINATLQCPQGWTLIGSKCFRPPEATGPTSGYSCHAGLPHEGDDGLEQAGCWRMREYCESWAGSVASPEEMHDWFKAGHVAPPETEWALTSRRKSGRRYRREALVVARNHSERWHRDCCASGEELFFVCQVEADKWLFNWWGLYWTYMVFKDLARHCFTAGLYCPLVAGIVIALLPKAPASRYTKDTVKRLRLPLFCKLWLWGFYTAHSYMADMWTQWDEGWPRCEQPLLSKNASGVKVLVYGLAKTGTKSMTRYLQDAGMANTYHSEEFLLHVYSPLAQDYWRRPENGGQTRWGHAMWDRYKAGKRIYDESADDMRVVRDTSREDWAAALGHCRVEAVAFDGIEALFWPVYEASPGVKVIVLDWRTWVQWAKSYAAFGPMMLLSGWYQALTYAPLIAGPWLLALRPLDYLFGSPIANWLKLGQPPFNTMYGFGQQLYVQPALKTRVWTHYFTNLAITPGTRQEYKGYWRDLERRVPKEDMFHWNMTKHTYEDLCEFIGTPRKDCPMSGRPKKNIQNLWANEFENPLVFLVFFPVLVLLHRANWMILMALARFYWRLALRVMREIRIFLCCARRG